MRIKVDIDNVIRDMGKAMVNVYNNYILANDYHIPQITKEDIKDYDVAKTFSNLDHPRSFFFTLHSEELYTEAEPMKDALEGLDRLKEMGYEIILVSYQPTPSARQRTLDWLDNWDVPYDALVFVNNEDKSLIQADCIIDDNPTHLDVNNKETKVCIDWAYNRKRNYDFRVKSILEFAKILDDGKKVENYLNNKFAKEIENEADIR